MGVFKEEVNKLEQLENQQTRVYPDACDVGIPATLEVKNIMRPIIKTLLELDESRVVHKVDTEFITERQYKLVVYFSQEDGVEFDVLYHGDKKHEFFSIESRRVGPPQHINTWQTRPRQPVNPMAALYKESHNVSDEELRTG